MYSGNVLILRLHIFVGVAFLSFLVTGAAGFIGSHLCDFLLSMGFRVIGLDNLSTGCLSNLSNSLGYSSFRFIRGDILTPEGWVGNVGLVDGVYHFAANPEVRQSTIDPLNHYKCNVEGTLNVLEFCRKFKVKHFVFASSSTVYGDPEVIPTPESHPIKPISIYGATKAMCEFLCQAYSKLYGFKCLILRYANIVGPRLKHGVIYDFMEKLRRDKSKLEILGDGTQVKSYLYITDALNATFKAYEKLVEEDYPFEIYNVGSMDQLTVKEIADIVVSRMGLSGVMYVYKPVTADGRGWPGDVKVMLLDTSKLTFKTGWKPIYDSRRSVEETVKSILLSQ
jgi:UDP-glucose 4-epimerase